MRTIMTLSLLLVILVLAETAICEPLKSGDRMVFIGDSITQQRINTRYVMNYFTLLPGNEH